MGINVISPRRDRLPPFRKALLSPLALKCPQGQAAVYHRDFDSQLRGPFVIIIPCNIDTLREPSASSKEADLNKQLVPEHGSTAQFRLRLRLRVTPDISHAPGAGVLLASDTTFT